MISGKITGMIGDAMRNKDAVRLSTLRMLSSELNYEKIAKQHELTQEEELSVILKEAKKRKEAIAAYESAGEDKRAEAEKTELIILQEFLPPEVSDEELLLLVTNAISETNASSIADMGKVMGFVKAKNCMVDGGKVAAIVKEKLS